MYKKLGLLLYCFCLTVSVCYAAFPIRYTKSLEPVNSIIDKSVYLNSNQINTTSISSLSLMPTPHYEYNKYKRENRNYGKSALLFAAIGWLLFWICEILLLASIYQPDPSNILFVILGIFSLFASVGSMVISVFKAREAVRNRMQLGYAIPALVLTLPIHFFLYIGFLFSLRGWIYMSNYGFDLDGFYKSIFFQRGFN